MGLSVKLLSSKSVTHAPAIVTCKWVRETWTCDFCFLFCFERNEECFLPLFLPPLPPPLSFYHTRGKQNYCGKFYQVWKDVSYSDPKLWSSHVWHGEMPAESNKNNNNNACLNCLQTLAWTASRIQHSNLTGTLQPSL